MLPAELKKQATVYIVSPSGAVRKAAFKRIDQNNVVHFFPDEDGVRIQPVAVDRVFFSAKDAVDKLAEELTEMKKEVDMFSTFITFMQINGKEEELLERYKNPEFVIRLTPEENDNYFTFADASPCEECETV